ncbi:MAG: hypothetical protein ACKVZJ_15980 [Phycisphaerales bacterium]
MLTPREPSTVPAAKARKARRARRGIALLLVLGMLAAVTILTAGALTSQQQAPTTGQNAIAEVQAKWSAESAAELAVAVLETTYDYTGTNAEMMVDQLIAQGLTNVCVTNLQGQPPAPGERELLLIAKAEVNGVMREVKKRISITPMLPPAAAADPMLNEFGIVATDGLVLEPGSEVKTWAASPDALSAKPAAIGAFTSAGAKVIIDPAACVAGAALFVGPDADASLVGMTGSDNLTPFGTKLPYDLPLTPEITPAAFAALPLASPIDLDLCIPLLSGTSPLAGRFESLIIKNGTVLTLDAAVGTHYSFKDVTISDSGVLRIKGAVVIQVRGALKLANLGAIVLDGADAAAAFFTHGDVEFDDAAAGIPLDVARDTNRSYKMITAETRPSRLRFYGQNTGSTSSFRIQKNALVAAVVHTPTNEVILDQAVLIGRAAARAVALSSGSSLQYDPRLDNRLGFTNIEGPLYGESAEALPEVTAALAGFSEAEGAQALKTRLTAINVAPTLSLANPIGGSGPTPTDRKKRVVHTCKVEDDDDADNDMIADEDEESNL